MKMLSETAISEYSLGSELDYFENSNRNCGPRDFAAGQKSNSLAGAGVPGLDDLR